METKYFKKIYSDKTGYGKWKTGDGINYNEPKDKSYTVEFITEKEYKVGIALPKPEKEIALQELTQSDTNMIRCIDDILDYIVNDVPIPDITKDKLNNRKVLRDKL